MAICFIRRLPYVNHLLYTDMSSCHCSTSYFLCPTQDSTQQLPYPAPTRSLPCYIYFLLWEQNQSQNQFYLLTSFPDPTTMFISIHFSPEELSYTCSLQSFPFSPSPKISQASTQLFLPVCVKVSRGPPLLHFKQKLTEVTNFSLLNDSSSGC